MFGKFVMVIIAVAGATAGVGIAVSTSAAINAGGGCDPLYTPCVPQSARDLDCDDLSGGPFTVVGTDRHRLDADDHGIGCQGKR